MTIMNKEVTSDPTLFALLDAVEYQPASVATHHLMRTPGGQITLFAFDAGQGLTPHTAPCQALVQLLEGEIEFTLHGQPLHMKAGECVEMQSGDPHALRALTRAKMMLTLLRG